MAGDIGLLIVDFTTLFHAKISQWLFNCYEQTFMGLSSTVAPPIQYLICKIEEISIDHSSVSVFFPSTGPTWDLISENICVVVNEDVGDIYWARRFHLQGGFLQN